MACPECNSPRARVLNTKDAKATGQRYRERVCRQCGHRFVTVEKLKQGPAPAATVA